MVFDTALLHHTTRQPMVLQRLQTLLDEPPSIWSRHRQPPRTCVHHARDQHSPREDETRGVLATPRVGWEPWQGGVESAGNVRRLSPCLQGPCPVQATTQMTWPGSSYGIFLGVPHGVGTKSGLAQAVAQLVYPRGHTHPAS